jgi:hypothetical protein
MEPIIEEARAQLEALEDAVSRLSLVLEGLVLRDGEQLADPIDADVG